MNKPRLLVAVCTCVFALSMTAPSYASLRGRDLDGNLSTAEAYFDTQLNITWMADADINDIGTWTSQKAWAEGLVIGGVSGWRLPSADSNLDGVIVNCFGGGVAGCFDNEMGYLFWEEGITATTPGPFSNVDNIYSYWSETPWIDPTLFRWLFGFAGGTQGLSEDFRLRRAWAVHSGDVGTAVVLPVPALSPVGLLLVAAGLLGAGAYCRDRA